MGLLYPPRIEGVIPGFSGDALVVPFQHNPLVGLEDYNKFSLMIKDIPNNNLIGTITADRSAVSNNSISFTGLNELGLVPGQHYKVQLAYDNNGVVGYYSTVATVKYCKPITITLNASNLAEIIGQVTTDDSQEGIYSYRFDMMYNDQTILTSGDVYYNNTVKEGKTYTMIWQPNEVIADINQGKVHIKLTVITTSQQKIVTEQEANITQIPNATLTCYNNYEQGWIEITKTDSGSIELYRSTDNIKWIYLGEFNSTAYLDQSIEQGQTYYYNANTNNEVYADFEDMFLSDNERNVRIRFNPKVTSFKTTQLEQKLDTIGGKYPIFFKNGQVGYKEFPISGLISCLMEDNEVEEKPREKTNTELAAAAIPDRGTDLTSNNIASERKYKLELLDWLNNGKPKLFRSPTEGNYIVRLMNVSLAPEEKLGRMLHTFSATAYEVMEYTPQNIRQFNRQK